MSSLLDECLLQFLPKHCKEHYWDVEAESKKKLKVSHAVTKIKLEIAFRHSHVVLFS